jgi:hypothetical protein
VVLYPLVLLQGLDVVDHLLCWSLVESHPWQVLIVFRNSPSWVALPGEFIFKLGPRRRGLPVLPDQELAVGVVLALAQRSDDV